jgi:hypothetical protein
MNLIVIPTRALLVEKIISSLLLLKIIGPPLTHFSPAKYVDLWLLQEHHSAIDTNSKEQSQGIFYENFVMKPSTLCVFLNDCAVNLCIINEVLISFFYSNNIITISFFI